MHTGLPLARIAEGMNHGLMGHPDMDAENAFFQQPGKQGLQDGPGRIDPAVFPGRISPARPSSLPTNVSSDST